MSYGMDTEGERFTGYHLGYQIRKSDRRRPLGQSQQQGYRRGGPPAEPRRARKVKGRPGGPAPPPPGGGGAPTAAGGKTPPTKFKKKFPIPRGGKISPPGGVGGGGARHRPTHPPGGVGGGGGGGLGSKNNPRGGGGGGKNCASAASIASRTAAILWAGRLMGWTPPTAPVCQSGGVDHSRRRRWNKLAPLDWTLRSTCFKHTAPIHRERLSSARNFVAPRCCSRKSPKQALASKPRIHSPASGNGGHESGQIPTDGTRQIGLGGPDFRHFARTLPSEFHH